MIELSYIYEYIVLAETLNFSRAANICYITQPALSRHIAAIEEEMGGKLLERTTRSVKLTPAGRSVYTSFKDIWQEYDSAKEQTKVLSAGIHGMLRLSSPYYWTEDFTEPVIRQFRRELPLCDVMVTSCQPNEGLVNLSEERTDIAVYPYVPDVDSRIRRVPFADEKLCVICRKDNPVAKKESVRADELTDELFVFTCQFNSDYDQYNRLIRSLLNAHGVYVKNSQFTQQVDTVGLTIQETDGVCIMPYGVRNMNRSYLKAVPISDEDCRMRMCLYYKIDNTNPLIPQYTKIACSLFSNKDKM